MPVSKNKKIAVKKICVIAMLLALTVVLSWISGYLRVGTFTKISISFISVYLSAVLYGPLAGCFVGVSADIISCIVVSLGTPIWEITLLEGFFGLLFGFVFYRGGTFVKNIYLRVVLCSLIRFIADVFIKTKVLSSYGFAPENFNVALATRGAGCIIMFVLTTAVLYVFEKFYTEKFIKMVNN